MTLVQMVNSAGEYVAGEYYDIDVETADRWIVLGYAKGETSREFTQAEMTELRATVQEVSV